MDVLSSADMLLLGTFRFDRRNRTLSRLDSGSQILLGSRAIGVLCMLLERAGDLVSRDDIMQAVWPEMVVEEANLTVHISTLRRVLDADRVEGSCIQTISGRGYRFIGEVIQPQSALPRDPEAAASSATASIEAVEITQPVSPRQRRGFTRAALILAVALCLAGVTAATVLTSSYRQPRPSIVVLPFKNLGDDPGQQYFADGITENLTTDLSRIRGIFVISRNTAFTYKDKPVNAKQIGRELSVRYMLEGSVQRAAKQVHVNVQLIDAEADAHLWAERFDLDIGDLLVLQNEITSRIAIALNRALIGAEGARRPANPDAVDYLFQARSAGLRPPTPDNFVEMIGLFERALALDPGFAEAKTRLAATLVGRVLLEMSSKRDADLTRAQDLIGQVSAGQVSAGQVSADTSHVHWLKGQLLRAQGRAADAVPEYEVAITLDPNFPAVYGNLAHTRLVTGSFEEVAPLIEQVIRLSPRDPDLGYWYDLIGLTHLLQSRTGEAIIWLEKARSANPTRPFIHADLAAAYGLKGDGERATAELAEARRLNQDPKRYLNLANSRRFGKTMTPNVFALYEATYQLGLRKAGMPEE